MPPNLIRLGTASPSTSPSTPETIDHILTLCQRAASQSIDILLLPEAFIGGYPRGQSFGCAVGSRTEAGRDEFARYFDSAVDLGDTVGDGGGAGEKWVKRETNLTGDGTREELERIASETGVFIVVGLIERTGGSLYCAVVYVCPREGIIGKRRKVMPTGMERLIWAQGAPSTLRAVSTIIRGMRINLAAAICWENYMPMVRQSLYQQNVNLYLAPTADGRDAWLSLMRTVGVEGRCFVVSSNMAVREGSTPGVPREDPVAVDDMADDAPQGRRDSVIIENGHEVALPRAAKSPTRRRRKSVFDPDGNEIVLSCDEDTKLSGAGESGKGISNGEAAFSSSQTQTSASWSSRGGSSIVSPFGDVLAGPQWEDDDRLIYADVDFKECIRGRLDLDAGGSYSRNDSFKMTVQGLNLDPLPY